MEKGNKKYQNDTSLNFEEKHQNVCLVEKKKDIIL
jgi:hypothetical protein